MEESGKGPASESSARKKGRTVAITTEDIQKRRNDVKARTTLLLALPDEHQLRFNKYETAKELWEAILKTFETLEQTFNRLQAIVSHLEFMDVEIKQDDLNQMFLTSLAPEWLRYTIVWRNRDDLDSISLDDMYNHLKVYEPEVQKKSESNSQNIAFISSSNTSSRKGEVHTASVPTAKNAEHLGVKTKEREKATNKEENHALIADDEVPTEFALMAKSSSSSDNEVYDDSYCSKSCRKNTKNLNTKISKINEELSDYETDLYNYKRGLSQVEARLVEFKENEVKYCERIRVLERDVEIRDNKIEYLKNELEQKDLSWTGLPEFVDDTVTDYRSIMSKPMIKFVKEADYPIVIKINNTENAGKSIVKYAEMYRNISKVVKNQPRVPRVSTVTEKIPTIDSKFPTAKSTLTANLGDKGKAVKASACWIQRPKQNTSKQDFKLNDDTNVVLRTPRQHNMYSIDLNNIVPHNNLTCLVAKASVDEKKTEHNTDFHQIVDFLEASHIRIETTDLETKIIATVDGKPRSISESSLRMHLKLNDEEGISSLPDAELFENLSLMGYNILPNQSCNIATAMVCLATNRVYNFSKIIFDDEPASLLKDDRQGEAFPTVSSLDAGQDMENIAKTSAMPHESSPRVLSLDADEGNIGEEFGADKSTEKRSNDTEEMVNVLSSTEAVNILSSGGATASVSPADVFPTAGVPTVSEIFPTVSAIFTTASVATPYTRRSRGITIGSLWPMRIPIISAKDKRKEKVTETKVPKKNKLQEQIDAQVARVVEEEFARENQRLSKHAARDYKIARIHAEEELKLMIGGLNRSNEVIAKHLSEYKQAEADLSVGKKIELISELVKYQGHLAKILKYQAHQSKPSSKKEQRMFYMSVIKSHAGWKT
uniref:Ribonuclease H-like domain-containing protein n=1 Tax=Tanacetum cinerariifolium TaxID=118510 RepID=A0A699GUK0_TANCI|nr:ribonuclease H-like domain-containing protein [Tanacetum cinerariifolium]